MTKYWQKEPPVEPMTKEKIDKMVDSLWDDLKKQDDLWWDFMKNPVTYAPKDVFDILVKHIKKDGSFE